MKKINLVLIAITIVLILGACGSEGESMILVQAHRGASHIAPDNTIAAFKAAAAMGADGFETEVQLTANGELVIQHNYGIDANSNGTGYVQDMTLEELRGYDFGSWFEAEDGSHPYEGERIATLSESLDIAEEMGFMVINVELKAPIDQTKGDVYVEKVAEEIRKHPQLFDRLIISAFDHTLLKRLKEEIPGIRVGALTTPDMSRLSTIPAEGVLASNKALTEYTIEDIEGLSDETLENLTKRVALLGLRGKGNEEIALEMCKAIGAMLPAGTSWEEAMVILSAEADPVDYVDNKLDFKIDFLHCFYGTLVANPTLVEEMHSRGIGVNVWTPNDENTLTTVIAAKPDGIITDEPALTLRLLGR